MGTNTKRQHMNLFKTFAIGLLLVAVVVCFDSKVDKTVHEEWSPVVAEDEEMPESAFFKSPEDTLTQSKQGWWHRHRRHKPAPPAPAPPLTPKQKPPARKCPICPFGMFAIAEVQVDGCPKCKPIKRKPCKCKIVHCPKCEEFANEYEMVQGKAEDQAIPCNCPPVKCQACKLPKPKPLPKPNPPNPKPVRKPVRGRL